MKTRITILLLFLLQFSVNHLDAQSYQNDNSRLPLKTNKSILFGKYIIINDQPDQNQRDVAICSAFNGWLYAVTTYVDYIDNIPALSLLKSIDNGMTWTLIFDGVYPVYSVKFRSVDIVTIGDSISNLKVFFAGVYSEGPLDLGQAIILRFNGETGDYEDELMSKSWVFDIAMATDYNFPANNSNPSTLGVLYSLHSYSKDTIIFQSSSNGGISLDNRQVIATSETRFHNVALSFGRSPSWSSGRYFAGWEDVPASLSTLGHIFSAHSEPDFNSPFTEPVCLDSLDPSAIGKVRNISIACQYNNVDNDSANLTEVIMFEKYQSAGNIYDLKGFYNLQATTSNYFNEFSVSSSSNYKIQPDICFNPYHSTFMLTYFDSTERKLPFLTNNVNLTSPNSWNIISQAYNDNTNLITPVPKIKLNIEQQEGMNAWISEGTGGKGIAMFDAPYNTWTGASESNKTNGNRLYGVFPNPCKTYTTVVFELDRSELVTISLFNVVGERTGTLTSQIYLEGKHQVNLDLSMYPAGCYLYTFNTGRFVSSGKIVVTK